VKIEGQQWKMMKKTSTAMGKDTMSGSSNTIKQMGKGRSMPRKQHGMQGQGGGSTTPLWAPHGTLQLSSHTTDSKEQVKREENIQQMSPFHAPQMDEDDEDPDNEKMEETDDMQSLLAQLGQRSLSNEGMNVQTRQGVRPTCY
jgi:hypothetical protein